MEHLSLCNVYINMYDRFLIITFIYWLLDVQIMKTMFFVGYFIDINKWSLHQASPFQAYKLVCW